MLLSLLRQWLVAFVLLLVNFYTICTDAQSIRRPNQPAMAGPPLPNKQIDIFYQTFQDAILIAREVAIWWPCDAKTDKTFLRYFKPWHAPFVENMFRAIANIPFDLVLSQDGLRQLLSDEPLTYSDRFNSLSIYFLGNHPGLNLPNGPGLPPKNCIQTPDGRLPDAFVSPAYNGNSPLISFCSSAYHSPMLQDILNPPNWAIDPRKDQSQGPKYYEGYGCENLGTADSDWMMSTGSLLLHELFHCPALFRDVPGYANWIDHPGQAYGSGPGSGPVQNIIDDYYNPGKDPDNGYGPYNAAWLREKTPTDQYNQVWLPIFNADNYMWYALSSFFSKRCGTVYEAAPNQKSAYPFRPPPQWPFSIPPTRRSLENATEMIINDDL